MNPTPESLEFKDRVVVVTGGSRGIGAGCCRSLAAAGAKVVVSGRDEGAIASVVKTIQTEGGTAIGVAADVTDVHALARLREKTEAAFGPAEILLAFAGGLGQPIPTSRLTEAGWRATLDANLTGTFLTVQTFLPGMNERKRGAIVTMASTAGRQPSLASIAYGAAKAGIIMFTRQLAVEAAPDGIRVNCIAPSAILTDRLEHSMPADRLAALADSFPLRRIGRPEDVAEAAKFLSSERSGWITGIVLDITGGRVIA